MATFETVLRAYNQRSEALAARTDRFAKGIAWIDGKFVPIEEARIPLLDQGFLHSDLTYDVPAVWDGRFFRLEDHLDRLEASCRKLRLRSPLGRKELRATLVDMVAASGLRDAYVELIVTRGLSFVRGEKPVDEMTNNLYLLALPYVWILPLAAHEDGAPAVVTRTVRRTPPGAMDPTIKNLQWGDFTRGLLEAQDRGAIYPILPDGDGNITEGSGYNIFAVKEGVLYTPRRGVLEGVTRKTVLEIAEAMQCAVRVEEVPVGLIYECEEIFFCSTAGGIMPVTSLDGTPVGDGKVGPLTRRIWEQYWHLHSDPRVSFAIDYRSAEVAAH